MGLRDLVNSAAYIQRAIFQKVRNTSGLLILDEAQHLTVQALDMVRAINDQTSIGLVLCGNDRVITQMTGGNRAPFLIACIAGSASDWSFTRWSRVTPTRSLTPGTSPMPVAAIRSGRSPTFRAHSAS